MYMHHHSSTNIELLHHFFLLFSALPFRRVESCFRSDKVACAREECSSRSTRAFCSWKGCFKSSLAGFLWRLIVTAEKSNFAFGFPLLDHSFYQLCEELQTSLTHLCIQDLVPLGSCMTLYCQCQLKKKRRREGGIEGKSEHSGERLVPPGDSEMCKCSLSQGSDS